MGLDITAYENVALIKSVTRKEWNSGAAYDYASGETFLYKDHPSRTQGDDLSEGIYRTSGQTHAFRAGSYSSYNGWRRKLAQLIGTTDESVWSGNSAPAFVELINFSDCEGFIGPKTSAKLAKDFADWQERAEGLAAEMRDGTYWLSSYAEWRKAFEIAAKGGVVKFH